MSEPRRGGGPLLGIVAFAVVVGLVGVGLRLRSGADDQPWFRYDEELGWAPRPAFEGRVGGAARHFDARGFLAADSAQVLPGDHPKIVFLGDDATFGAGVATDGTFVELADRAMPGVDLLNLGVMGYSVHQGRKLLPRALAVDPAVVVVAFHFNDRRYVFPENVDSETHFRRFAEKGADPRGAGSPVVPDTLYIPDLKTRVKEDAYRRHLTHMARSVKTTGARVAFLLLADNPGESQDLHAGMTAREAGHLEIAADHLMAAVRAGNAFSDIARLQLAHVYQAQERPADQEAILHTPAHLSPHGGNPLYAESRYARIMRETAGAESAVLIDATLTLAPTDYADARNPNASGHRKLAELLTARLPGMLDGAP